MTTARDHGPAAIPDFLRPTRSLLVAILDPEGCLIDANAGFVELLGEPAETLTRRRVQGLFVNPDFAELKGAFEGRLPGDCVYEGLMTLGDPDGTTETWVGRMQREEAGLLLVCERDIDRDRRIQAQLLTLTEEFADKERALAQANRELERLYLTDTLTGLPNRRHFDRLLEHNLDSAARYREPFALLILDLDRFKEINDRRGHAVGDEALQQVAGALQDGVRAADFVARWGGEEFVVLAPKTDAAGAAELAERLRQRLARKTAGSSLPGITASIGVAVCQPGESADALFRRADRALYRAKEQGRNRVVMLPPDAC